jgi:hypothetical protein
MAQTLSPVPKLAFLDNNGKPAVGYKLFTYEAGSSTKLATYVDSAGGTPNANPIVLDYRGEANVWVPPNVAYKYVFAKPNDTDPPGSPVWSVDNLVNSQLITLYGGVDTGSANAYILNFVANFSSYTDGIVIYWIPSNTNTGASTINVNGLGPVAITNQDGTALVAGQLAASQTAQIIYRSGSFLLLQSAVLTSIWGGTSTFSGGGGPISTYTLSAPQVPAYYDGLLLYWEVSNTNTFPCRMIVNGGLPRPIIQQNGDALEVNMLRAGEIAQIIYVAGNFILISPLAGRFTATLTGVDATVTATAFWTRSGSAVSIYIPDMAGTSNSTFKSITGLPSEVSGGLDQSTLTVAIDNGGSQEVILARNNPPAIDLTRLSGAWTNTGAFSMLGFTMSWTA